MCPVCNTSIIRISLDPATAHADLVVHANEVCPHGRPFEYDLVAHSWSDEPRRCLPDLPGRIAFRDLEDIGRPVDLPRRCDGRLQQVQGLGLFLAVAPTEQAKLG